jgi:hypothetical protein
VWEIEKTKISRNGTGHPEDGILCGEPGASPLGDFVGHHASESMLRPTEQSRAPGAEAKGEVEAELVLGVPFSFDCQDPQFVC